MQSCEDKPCAEEASITVSASSLTRCNSEPELDVGGCVHNLLLLGTLGRESRR
jgi:hypothetical protein